MGSENITLYFDVCNHTAGTCNFPTTTTATATTTTTTTTEQVLPVVIGIIASGGVAGIAALVV